MSGSGSHCFKMTSSGFTSTSSPKFECVWFTVSEGKRFQTAVWSEAPHCAAAAALLQKRAENQAQLTGEQPYQQSESGLHSLGSFAGICARVIYIRTPRSKLWSKPVDGNYRENNFNNTLQDMKKMFQAMGLWRQQWMCVWVQAPQRAFKTFKRTKFSWLGGKCIHHTLYVGQYIFMYPGCN